MKRTKDNWLSGPRGEIGGASGLTYFEGEDLQYIERKKAFQETQRKWIEEFLEEKNAEKVKEEDEERAWNLQMAQNNQIRGFLEDRHNQLVRNKNEEYKRANMELSRLKKLKDKEEKLRKLDLDREYCMQQTAIRELSPYINPFKN